MCAQLTIYISERKQSAHILNGNAYKKVIYDKKDIQFGVLQFGTYGIQGSEAVLTSFFLLSFLDEKVKILIIKS